MDTIPQRIAKELSIRESQALTAISLLDEGATVPFIARYRKEMTGELTDKQLRTLVERLYYLRELDERREVIINRIREQEKLTPELEAALYAAETKVRLEDLYLPYKPKRRNKAQIARMAGLEPLALALLQEPTLVPEQAAQAYLNPDQEITDTTQALEGARQILMEKFLEEPELLGQLREYFWENALLISKVIEGQEEKGEKFADYFEHQEPLKTIPSHRLLALLRGRQIKILRLHLTLPTQADGTESTYCEHVIAKWFNVANAERPADHWLLETVHWAWQFKIRLRLETELLTKVREMAEAEAIQVFANNLQDLLLAAPAGSRVTMGLDPGLRTGVKVAVVDSTGKLVDYATIYPHPPKNQWQEAIAKLAELVAQHHVELISIGNGTGSRETDKLIADLIKQHPELSFYKVMVSEAGASVYSASELATQELPQLDVSLRGAVSIARRLQDPLAELVKIDPKSIGVGQYQHDVNQTQLAHSLDAVIEDCVNAVGVDVNTASVPLLSRVAGLNAGIAQNIVTFRNENGIFLDRDVFKKIPRLGEKTFEQAAGFLRIRNGNNPLDASSVHPEAYPIVERIIANTEKPIHVLMGNKALLRSLNPSDFTDERFGIPTVTDILMELEKPGRDPRPEFKTAHFNEEVKTLEDLQEGMILEGVVTNVTHFGAFIDIGVHQDGLVHISALSNDYVEDPRRVVKAGDVVKVKVLNVDLKRQRVALTMRLEEVPPVTERNKAPVPKRTAPSRKSRKKAQPVEKKTDSPDFVSAIAIAFEKARQR
ncbi:MAG: RNA-binding transcriptional accessory protein [Beggiatoa sp. IS2]|nr:MAG: RNA-binding transcriptional accessory protein [Beggiatoa sp. IS2]